MLFSLFLGIPAMDVPCTDSQARVENSVARDLLATARQAASGNIEAMVTFGRIAQEENRIDEARYWLARAAIGGSFDGFRGFYNSLSDNDRGHVFSEISEVLKRNSHHVRHVNFGDREHYATVLRGRGNNPDAQIDAMMSAGYSVKEAIRILARIGTGDSIDGLSTPSSYQSDGGSTVSEGSDDLSSSLLSDFINDNPMYLPEPVLQQQTLGQKIKRSSRKIISCCVGSSD